MFHSRFLDGYRGNGAVRPILGNRDATELNLAIGRDIWTGISFQAMLACDLRIDGSYAQVGLQKKWRISERAEIGLPASTGYGIDDFFRAALAWVTTGLA